MYLKGHHACGWMLLVTFALKMIMLITTKRNNNSLHSVTLLCVLVVKLNFLPSELCLMKTTGVLFCRSSPIFGKFVFFQKCLVNGTQEINSWLSVYPGNYQKETVCYCRKSTAEKCVDCCNPNCAIVSFHLSCLKIESIPKTWYCPHCIIL